MRKRFSRFSRLGLVLLAAAALSLPAAPAEAAPISYGCNPSATGWKLEGDWGGGTVWESRVCIRYDAGLDEVQGKYEFRVRDGGTPIQSDWDLSEAYGGVWNLTAGAAIPGTIRVDFVDTFNTSYIAIFSYWGCTTMSSIDHYSYVAEVSVNPNGPLPESSRHSAVSYVVNDSNIPLC